MSVTLHVRPVLRSGGLAHFDTVTGCIPCKVLSITGESGAASSLQRVTVKTTATRGAFKKGEVISGILGLHVIPRGALFPRRSGARIGYYTIEVDKAPPVPPSAPGRKLYTFTDGQGGNVAIHQSGPDNFAIQYGMQICAKLTYGDAAREFGECVFHSLACAGLLDNSEKGEQ